jgi:4-carboxymuconolactone decarboxylase
MKLPKSKKHEIRVGELQKDCQIKLFLRNSSSHSYTLTKKGGAMYLPKIYEKFSGKFPEVFNDFKKLGQTCRETGPLDQKTQDLIKLGIAIGANSRGAVMSNTRKALETGATADEIAHAVLLALTTTGFPNMIAALQWVDEVIQET